MSPFASGRNARETYRIGETQFSLSNQGFAMLDNECQQVLTVVAQSSSAKGDAKEIIARSPAAKRLAQRYPNRSDLERLERRCKQQVADAIHADLRGK